MKALVTGGGGFLGGAVVRLLRARGDEVRSFTRSNYPWLDELGVEQSLGDLADLSAVENAVAIVVRIGTTVDVLEAVFVLGIVRTKIVHV